MKKLFLILTLLLIPALAVAAPGNGKGKGAKSLLAADSYLHYQCETDACAAGDIVYFQGAGLDGSQYRAALQIGVSLWSAVAVAADGTVAFQWNYFQIPGSYSVTLWQYDGGNFVPMVSVIVTVH